MVRVFSRLGLKPNFLIGYWRHAGRKVKRTSACGLKLRPRPLDVDFRVKSIAGVDWVPGPDSGRGWLLWRRCRR